MVIKEVRLTTDDLFDFFFLFFKRKTGKSDKPLITETCVTDLQLDGDVFISELLGPISHVGIIKMF